VLKTAQSLITRASQKLGLDQTTIESVLKADAAHAFDITLSSGKTFKAYRVQHNNKRGPYKGGIRYHPEVHLEEVQALAMLMSLKTAAIGLPLGGGKGGVAVDPKQLADAELEELSRKYSAHMVHRIGPTRDIPAPDVNTDGRTIDWMVDEYGKLTGDTSKASFTGKTLANGGSKGRDAATGYGGVIALHELLQRLGKADEELTIAIQGYGNVGSFFCLKAEELHPHWKLVAVGEVDTTLYNPEGLSALQLTAHKGTGNKFKDYQADGTSTISQEELLSADVDVLVLAALGDVITKDNMRDVQAKYILELANGPVDERAYDYLSHYGVVILPDIIANAGGVIVSYLEWLQNAEGEHWSLDKVNASMKEYMVTAVENTYNFSVKAGVPLKEAALMLGLKRLID
jgi:glutamate dehydrogenase/leucine dehydrogenase